MTEKRAETEGGGWTVKPRPHVTPSIDCPFCAAYVYVTDDACWRCGRVFTGGELMERYEDAHP
jgi:hypothetical protein